jgi:hypothetical protein
MIKELRYYLETLRDLVRSIPPTRPVYAEGSTVGQIAYHASQATNNMLRVYILRGTFERDREAEYGKFHEVDEVLDSIDMAFEACDMLNRSKIRLDDKLLEPREVKSAGFVMETNLDVLIHAVSHLAEHCGELSQVLREVKKGR